MTLCMTPRVQIFFAVAYNIVLMVMTLTIIILLLLLLWYWWSVRDLVEIHLPGRGETYVVTKKYGDEVEAAKLMSEVNESVIGVLKYMREKYMRPGASKLHREITSNMLYNYNPEVIVENTPGGSDTSYTINKGRRMYVCIRDGAGKLLDPHTVTFVVLHELAHIGHYYGWGHGQSYWEVFKFVLTNAAESGVHQPVNYRYTPRKYCGIAVTYNPIYDDGVKNI